MYVQGQDEEARQRIVLLEELLQHFGCKMEVREMELHQWLEEVHTSYATLVKELHDLKQYTITKMALCIARINTLEGQTKEHFTLIQHTSTIYLRH